MGALRIRGRGRGTGRASFGGFMGQFGRGAKNSNWHGGRTITPRGYVKIAASEHPRADKDGYVYEHILVAEKVLGKYLPPGAVVHHINEERKDNRPENLVICQDENYHRLLHQRIRAFKGCGNVNWKSCRICKRWDDPAKMYVNPKTGAARHNKCQNEYRRATNK